MKVATAEIWKSVAGLFVGLAFSFVMSFVGGAFAGAGHGTLIFSYLIAAPSPFGLLIWPLLALLFPWWQKTSVSTICLLPLVTIHLFFIYNAMHTHQDEGLDRALNAVAFPILLFCGIYLIAIGFVWSRIVPVIISNLTAQKRIE